jgi:hypothetical protein
MGQVGMGAVMTGGRGSMTGGMGMGVVGMETGTVWTRWGLRMSGNSARSNGLAFPMGAGTVQEVCRIAARARMMVVFMGLVVLGWEVLGALIA